MVAVMAVDDLTARRDEKNKMELREREDVLQDREFMIQEVERALIEKELALNEAARALEAARAAPVQHGVQWHANTSSEHTAEHLSMLVSTNALEDGARIVGERLGDVADTLYAITNGKAVCDRVAQRALAIVNAVPVVDRVHIQKIMASTARLCELEAELKRMGF
jgi:hypothetical protein